MPSPNKHIGKITAVIPLERQCEFESYYPALTFVKAATSPSRHHVSQKQRTAGQDGRMNEIFTTK